MCAPARLIGGRQAHIEAGATRPRTDENRETRHRNEFLEQDAVVVCEVDAPLSLAYIAGQGLPARGDHRRRSTTLTRAHLQPILVAPYLRHRVGDRLGEKLSVTRTRPNLQANDDRFARMRSASAT